MIKKEAAFPHLVLVLCSLLIVKSSERRNYKTYFLSISVRKIFDLL
jgi:hypothetical protein